MAFKMKGPSLHQGTAGHKKQLKVNRTLEQNMPDGRSMSSPLQAATDPEEKITWEPEKQVSTETIKNEKGGEDTTTKFETKGTSSTHKPTKTDDQAFSDWEKKNPSGKRSEYTKQRDEYIKSKTKTHVKKREEKASTHKKIDPIPKLGPKPVEIKQEEEFKPKKARYRKPPKKKSWVKKTKEKIEDAIYRAKQSNVRRPRKKRCRKKKGGTSCPTF